MNNHISVELDSHPIELCKLLKVANIVGGGGEAKVVISEGYVLVNGEVECQKRKKIYHQDIVEFNGDIVEVICHAPITQKIKSQKEKSSDKNADKPAQDQPQPKHSQSKQTQSKHTQSTQKRAKSNLSKYTQPKNSPPLPATNTPAQPENKGKRKRISF